MGNIVWRLYRARTDSLPSLQSPFFLPPSHLLQHNEDCLCLPHPGLSDCSGGVRARFRKLEKEEQRLGCSILEISKCQKEVEKALEDCSHIDITDLDTVMTCVNDILAMTDCQKCICDILPIC